jgi:hypothetical protein
MADEDWKTQDHGGDADGRAARLLASQINGDGLRPFSVLGSRHDVHVVAVINILRSQLASVHQRTQLRVDAWSSRGTSAVDSASMTG